MTEWMKKPELFEVVLGIEFRYRFDNDTYVGSLGAFGSTRRSARGILYW